MNLKLYIKFLTIVNEIMNKDVRDSYILYITKLSSYTIVSVTLHVKLSPASSLNTRILRVQCNKWRVILYVISQKDQKVIRCNDFKLSPISD